MGYDDIYASQLTNSNNFGNQVSEKDKAFTLRTSTPNGILLKFKPLENYMTEEFDGTSRLHKGIFNFLQENKGVCQTAGGGHANKYFDLLVYRKLTPIECERLQTVPDNYTDCVSNTQRYKMLGNGWTVDVIAHILKGLK